MPNVGSQIEAIKLFKEWYGNKKNLQNYVLDIKKFPKSLPYLGTISKIEYISDREGSPKIYYHEFKNNNKPLILSDPFGRFIILYANLRVSKDGIIDYDDFIDEFPPKQEDKTVLGKTNNTNYYPTKSIILGMVKSIIYKPMKGKKVQSEVFEDNKPLLMGTNTEGMLIINGQHTFNRQGNIKKLNDNNNSLRGNLAINRRIDDLLSQKYKH